MPGTVHAVTDDSSCVGNDSPGSTAGSSGQNVCRKPSIKPAHATDPAADVACCALLAALSAMPLMNKYFLWSTLIIAGREPQERLLRRAHANSLLVSLVIEMAWNACSARSPAPATAALFLLLSTLLTTYVSLAAFDPYERLPLNLTIGFALMLSASLALIPANALSVSFRLTLPHSSARYKMIGWLVAVSLGTVILLEPRAVHPAFVVTMNAVIPLCVSALLIRKELREVGARSEAARPGRGLPRNDFKPCDERIVDERAVLCVPFSTAASFLLSNCLVGTHAEAINDMAITLAVRDSLSQGQKNLALANNLSVMASQALALVSETQIATGNLVLRNAVFLSLWTLCQLLRSVCVDNLGSDAASSGILVVLVFADKYSGPLGAAALETVSIDLLKSSVIKAPQGKAQHSSRQNAHHAAKRAAPPFTANTATTAGATAEVCNTQPEVKSSMYPSAQRRPGVPIAFLESLRYACMKYERPLWDWLLLSREHWLLPLPVVVAAFSLLNACFVLIRLRCMHNVLRTSAGAVKASKVKRE